MVAQHKVKDSMAANHDNTTTTIPTIELEFGERPLDTEQLRNLERHLIPALQGVRALLGKPPVIVPKRADWGKVGE